MRGDIYDRVGMRNPHVAYVTIALQSIQMSGNIQLMSIEDGSGFL